MLISLQVFTLLGIFIPGAWTPFHDLIIAGLSLFEAIFLPFIFFLCDSAFREATKKSCYCQKSDKISSKSQHHHASLAFSERNLLSPSYLSGKKSGLTTFQSELDLSKTQGLFFFNFFINKMISAFFFFF